MDKPVELSAVQARRVALAAQRFGQPRPPGGPGLDQLRRLVGDLGAVQIDAVNVLVRSHYLPFYSRLGPYPAELADGLAYRQRVAFEYWGHAASFLPIELYPAVRWRMARYEGGKHWAAFRERVDGERPGYLAAILREIGERGPLAYTGLSDPARREKGATKYADSSLLWYRWSDGKSALEGLFAAGRLAVAGRRGFERLYDLAERVIPAAVRSARALPEDEAQRSLAQVAVRALGVATVTDVADYFRMPVAATRARLGELAAGGQLALARVEGWTRDAYLDPAADPAPVQARALLSPFDSLIWERDRTRRIFGFEHLFELYVRPEKRRYGYYVLPFLLGDAIVARVDLKADRKAGTLQVLGAFAEPGAQAAAVAGELSAQLRELAAWLGLERLEIAARGDLAGELRKRELPVGERQVHGGFRVQPGGGETISR